MILKTQAFSLIELLVVLAIIGILAAFAIPSYRQHIERARFTEIIAAAMPYKTAVAVALQTGETMDTLNTGENGVPTSPPPTKNLASLTVDNSVITATGTKSAGSYTYILTPNKDGAHWTISGTCLDAGLCKS